MGWMWLIWPLLVLGTALVVVLLVRGAGGPTNRGGGEGPPPGAGGRTRAQEILDERYARGELTDEEYQDRLRHLRGETDR